MDERGSFSRGGRPEGIALWHGRSERSVVAHAGLEGKEDGEKKRETGKKWLQKRKREKRGNGLRKAQGGEEARGSRDVVARGGGPVAGSVRGRGRANGPAAAEGTCKARDGAEEDARRRFDGACRAALPRQGARRAADGAREAERRGGS